jgi:hypothetical protein
VTEIADGQIQAPANISPAPIVTAAPPCPEPILKSSYYRFRSTYIKPAAKLFSPIFPALSFSPALPVSSDLPASPTLPVSPVLPVSLAAPVPGKPTFSNVGM